MYGQTPQKWVQVVFSSMIKYDWFVPYPMTKLQCFFFSKAAKLDVV